MAFWTENRGGGIRNDATESIRPSAADEAVFPVAAVPGAADRDRRGERDCGQPVRQQHDRENRNERDRAVRPAEPLPVRDDDHVCERVADAVRAVPGDGPGEDPRPVHREHPGFRRAGGADVRTAGAGRGYGGDPGAGEPGAGPADAERLYPRAGHRDSGTGAWTAAVRLPFAGEPDEAHHGGQHHMLCGERGAGPPVHRCVPDGDLRAGAQHLAGQLGVPGSAGSMVPERKIRVEVLHPGMPVGRRMEDRADGISRRTGPVYGDIPLPDRELPGAELCGQPGAFGLRRVELAAGGDLGGALRHGGGVPDAVQHQHRRGGPAVHGGCAADCDDQRHAGDGRNCGAADRLRGAADGCSTRIRPIRFLQ